MNCVCCEKLDIIMESELSFVICDKYPVSKGHVLIIPKRHVSSYFDLEDSEKEDMNKLLDQMKIYLDKEFKPDDYNIGINVDKAAGQTVMHVHMHLIPRYSGDMGDPRGGIRGAIPDKRVY